MRPGSFDDGAGRANGGSPVDDLTLRQARILIVDDQQANVLLLERLLASFGFRAVTATTRSDQAEALCDSLDPDLLLLDLQMPPPDGIEVLRRLRSRPSGPAPMPIIVLTADNTTEAKRRALAGGANDFLHKPFDAVEVVLRIKNQLSTRMLQLALNVHNDMLERRVEARTEQLEQARIEIIERLAHAAEYRDDDTGQHTRRVAQISGLLAERLGLPDGEVARIRRAAPLHDVGKIAIPDAILLKPGKLTSSEFNSMKTHTTIGAEILSGSQSRLLRLAEEIARSHHERWDGTGYPAALAGAEIPIAGRIVALADVFDALSHRRPYKPAWSVAESVEEIRRLAGSHFDPTLVDAFDQLDQDELADQNPSGRTKDRQPDHSYVRSPGNLAPKLDSSLARNAIAMLEQ
jgi:putative nucleotidyltransferase with HDIG domain